LKPSLASISVSSPSKAKAEACGKTILIGEHAVIYGARAIAAPLTSCKFEAELTPLDYKSQNTLSLGGTKVGDNLIEVINDAFRLLDITPFPVSIKGDTSLPIGAGLGSSASLAIVILRMISQSIGYKLERNQLAKLANSLEERFHGSPSGLDTHVIAYEQVISFRKNEACEILNVAKVGAESPWRFVLIDSGLRSSTKAMVQTASPYFETRRQYHVDEFDSLADLMQLGLNSGDESKAAEAMKRAATKLEEAGLVNETLKEIIDGCYQSGLIAAKPTGAGGGGCILALASNTEYKEQYSTLQNKLSSYRMMEVNI